MKTLYNAFIRHRKSIILFICFFCFILDYSQAQTEIATAKQYLRDNAQKQKLAETDLSEMTVSSAYLSPTTGWYHVYFNQNYQSVEVYNSLINMVLQQNKVQYSVGNFISNIASKVNTNTIKNVKLSPLQALQKTTTHLKLTASDISKIQEIGTVKLLNGTVNEATFSDTQLSDENIEVKLYWLPVETKDGEKNISKVKLSWNVRLSTKDKQNIWSIHVDAVSGDILRQIDEVIHCNFGTLNHLKTAHVCSNKAIIVESKKIVAANSYNVFDIPLESPNHGVRTLVSNPYARFVPTGTGPGATNGWHNDGTTDYTNTRGNNVYAKEDLANNDGIGASPSSPILEFDHPYTLGENTATGNQNAAITNLFYWNNLIHDILWKYGFDEPSGNFQNDNQGRGGLGNDFVYADAQDGGGTNNANFSAPVDGGNGRMQMYLWNNAGATPYQPDGDFDNGIIAHEYGHGWSVRLTGGPANSSCLQNVEQGGEGWSDYMALMFGTNWASLTPSLASANIPRGIGTYALGQDITGAGIRPYRYSYDKTNINNEVTYSKVADFSFSQPHGIGSIWATMLWDMTWEIIFQDNIIISDIYNTPALVSNMRGNVAALKLVNEGLRLQPCSPSFVDARNAILSADQMLFGGRYRCAIGRAFSRRGLGLNASTGTSSNDRTVTEDFTLIAGNALSSANNLSICSGKVFNYTATSLTNGTNFAWNRPVVAGISNVEKSGNTASVTDTLVNTTNQPIKVTYYFSLTPDLCASVPAQQAVNVMVNPTVVPTISNYTICRNGTMPNGAGFIVPEANTNLVNNALTSTSPVFNRGGILGSYHYKAYSFVAPSSGIATFEITDALLSDGGNDTYLYFYHTSFDPASPTSNLIAYDDDGGDGLLSLISQTLTAGTTYVIVATTYESNFTGTFQLQASIPIFSNKVSWYKNASGGTPLAMGSLFNPVGVMGSGIPNTAISGTTNFYVTNEANPDCRTTVTFKIDSSLLNNVSSIINPTTCGGNDGSISFKTRNLPDGIYSFNYQTINPITSNPINVNVVSDSFKLSNLSERVYYNFAISYLGCSDTITTNIMLRNPYPIVQNNITINLTESITLTATGCESGAMVSWYKLVDNILVNMPITPSDTTRYYAKCVKTNSNCVSSKSEDVTVNVIPVIVSIATGDWEAANTWNAGRIPKNGDFVIIDQNHTVTLNGESSVKTIEYRGTGTLKYKTMSSKLNTGF